LETYLKQRPDPVVNKSDYFKLVDIEDNIASERGLELYKFGTNEEMLEALGISVLG